MVNFAHMGRDVGMTVKHTTSNKDPRTLARKNLETAKDTRLVMQVIVAHDGDCKISAEGQHDAGEFPDLLRYCAKSIEEADAVRLVH